VLLHYQKGRLLRGCGSVLVGIALLFVGIDHLKEGFESIRAGIDLSRFAIPGFLGVVVYTLVGAAATVVIQSSHATLVLIITALSAGQVTYENALALAIGANIGTTITAILGAIGANIEGRRLAAAHLVFNMVTAVLAVLLLPQLAQLVTVLARTLGIPAGDLTLELALFHTLFNTLGIVVMLPALRPLVGWLRRVLPAPLVHRGTPRYLNESVLELADTTLESMHMECEHLFENVLELLTQGLGLPERWIEDPEADLDEELPLTRPLSAEEYSDSYQNSVKALYGHILTFVARAPEELTSDQRQELQILRDSCRGLVEAVKGVKHLRKNMLRFLTGRPGTIRDEYAEIRRRLAEVLQNLRTVRSQAGDPAHVLSLDALRLELEEQDTTMNGRLEQLIRRGDITPEVATSLMNDAGYAYDVTEALVQGCTALFGSSEPAMRDAGLALLLDEDDMLEITEPPPHTTDGED
jgi:phosphate:Na+ symporter